MKPRMLTLAEAADRIGCSGPRLSRLMAEGRCPGAKIAGRWRVDADVLEQWLADRQRDAANTPKLSIQPPAVEMLPALTARRFA